MGVHVHAHVFNQPRAVWGVHSTRIATGRVVIEFNPDWSRADARKEARAMRKMGYADAHVVRADMSQWRPDS